MDEQVGPSFFGFNSLLAQGSFTARMEVVPTALNTLLASGLVHDLGCSLVCLHILCIHFMFGQILHFNGSESARGQRAGSPQQNQFLSTPKVFSVVQGKV